MNKVNICLRYHINSRCKLSFYVHFHYSDNSFICIACQRNMGDEMEVNEPKDDNQSKSRDLLNSLLTRSCQWLPGDSTNNSVQHISEVDRNLPSLTTV